MRRLLYGFSWVLVGAGLLGILFGLVVVFGRVDEFVGEASEQAFRVGATSLFFGGVLYLLLSIDGRLAALVDREDR